MKDTQKMTDEEFDVYLKNQKQLYVIVAEVAEDEIVEALSGFTDVELGESGGGFDVCPEASELDFDCEGQAAFDRAFAKLKELKHPLVVHFGKESVEGMSESKLTKLERAWEDVIQNNTQYFVDTEEECSGCSSEPEDGFADGVCSDCGERVYE